ncbi:MAG: hypothetical protein ACI8PB_003605, partial [Desulforhopalus sp.]
KNDSTFIKYCYVKQFLIYGSYIDFYGINDAR